MCKSAIPFGLLFLEKECTLGEPPPVTYDEEQDVWVLEANGERIPLVSAIDPRMGTETVTEVAGEDTDAFSQEAYPPCWLSTDTETKAAEDDTLQAVQAGVAEAWDTETETRIPGQD